MKSAVKAPDFTAVLLHSAFFGQKEKARLLSAMLFLYLVFTIYIKSTKYKSDTRKYLPLLFKNSLRCRPLMVLLYHRYK